MDSGIIAVTHPGKLGDALYCLPSVRALMNDWKVKADFYTSEYCRPMKNLMLYQTGIEHFIVPEAYEVLRMDMGVQPWKIPVDGSLYDKVVHMGFRLVPDRPLPDFIAQSVGVPKEKLPRVYYEYPEIPIPSKNYICIAPRGETTFKSLFYDVVRNSPVDVAIIGGTGDNTFTHSYNYNNNKVFDLTGLDMLDTVSWLANSRGFVGLMSAMLVLANGFDFPKIAVHDGIHWDMRHIVTSETNHYPVNPDLNKIMEILNL